MTDLKKSIESLRFFQVYIETKIGDSLDGLFTEDDLKKIDRNKVVKLYTDDSEITTDNWDTLKETFFGQRMEIYPDSYTQQERIRFELKGLQNLSFQKRDDQVLEKRYKKYLLIKSEPPPPLENQKIGQLTNKQKALIAVYTKQTINRKDGNAIYNEFTHFSSRQNRIGSEQTDLKLKNKIKLLNSVLEHLPQEYKSTLVSEIELLKTKQPN